MKMGKIVICPLCGESGQLTFAEKRENVNIRGVEVLVTKVTRKCECCDQEYENTKDHDWKREAFDKYREAVGIPSAKEIKYWREENNLTQAEASNLLGWGAATIGRYEKGSLPTTAQADQLKHIMTDDGLLKALEEKPFSVSKEKMGPLVEKLREGALKAQYVNIMRDVHFTVDQDLNGGSEFSFEKAASLVGILCQFRETKTKLNKLIFYADFISKKILGNSITGMQYARINFGPVPERYDTLYECLNVLKVVNVEDYYYGYPTRVVSPGEVSYEDYLSPDEIRIASAVREYFKAYSATEIADYSHNEKAWIYVPNGGRIPYSYADEINNLDKIIG